MGRRKKSDKQVEELKAIRDAIKKVALDMCELTLLISEIIEDKEQKND